MTRFLLILLCASLPNLAHAGLYYSGESFNPLPAQWRGFLLDQKTLRGVALPPGKGEIPSPVRAHYLEEAARLEKKRDRTPNENADLGAMYVRLGESGKAVTLLRPAQAEHPNHFHIAANLGTAWQLQGDLAQAAACLEQAFCLAPGKFLKAEEHHLHLVRERLKNRGAGGLDDLFGVRYTWEDGSYRPGTMPPDAKKHLPANAVAHVQQLALWLPADGPLLWQLAELANAHGDVKTAANLMDGCVIHFGMSQPELRRRRNLTRAEAGPVATSLEEGKTEHGAKHTSSLVFRSRRALVSRLDLAPLPPVNAKGVNELPWPLILETSVDKKFRPEFPQHLKELDGHQVRLVGFMQPMRAETDMAIFLFIEYPVGCWFCETPEPTGIVLIEMEEGQSATYQRGLQRVLGRLFLNPSNPEDFLYTIRAARIAPLD